MKINKLINRLKSDIFYILYIYMLLHFIDGIYLFIVTQQHKSLKLLVFVFDFFFDPSFDNRKNIKSFNS